MPEPYLSFFYLTKFQNAILAILFKVMPSQPEKNAKIAFLNFVNKKLRFGSDIIGWVFVCVFCKQNAKMTKFVRKIVIFEFCKQNTLTVTLCMMPEPYLSFLQTEFKNVIWQFFSLTYCWGHQSYGAWAPEVWCPSKLTKARGTRVLVPGHQKSGAPPSWLTGFCFNFKNGLQNFEFLLFANHIYVFYTKLGFIRTWSARMSVQWWKNPKK